MKLVTVDIDGAERAGVLLGDHLLDRTAAAAALSSPAATGSVLDILKGMDLNEVRNELQTQVRDTSGQRRKKAIKRLRVIEAFRKSGNKPEWMVLTVLPVLPPELHPMV